MARPGVTVLAQSQPSPRGLSTSTGTVFLVGAAQKGPTTTYQLIKSMTDFTTYLGSRQTYSLLWDWCEAFFREGGLRAYVARVVGSGAATATRTLSDSASGTSLAVSAKNQGLWGNNLSVQLVQSGSTYQLVITDAVLGQVDASPFLADQASAVQWSLSSNWVNVSIPNGAGSNIPAVLSASALSSGADDNTTITDASRQAALGFFPALLGPGQVCMPGNTTTANRSALKAHARANNRQAIFDSINSASASALVSDVSSMMGDEFGAAFTPWLIGPGVLAGTTRLIPPTALAAALMARSDGTYSPNVPAAGDNGKARWALDVAASFTDTDRDTLDAGGVNLFRSFSGAVTLYDYITLANPAIDTSWLNLGNQRLRMKIVDQLKAVAHTFMFDQIDGRGLKIAEFQAALTGVLMPYYNDGSLFGATPAEAFNVDVGASVNTPDTIAAGQLNGAVNARFSPYAKQVFLGLIKVPVNQSL